MQTTILEDIALLKAHVKGHTRRTKGKVTHVRAHERRDRGKKPREAGAAKGKRSPQTKEGETSTREELSPAALAFVSEAGDAYKRWVEKSKKPGAYYTTDTSKAARKDQIDPDEVIRIYGLADGRYRLDLIKFGDREKGTKRSLGAKAIVVTSERAVLSMLKLIGIDPADLASDYRGGDYDNLPDLAEKTHSLEMPSFYKYLHPRSRGANFVWTFTEGAEKLYPYLLGGFSQMLLPALAQVIRTGVERGARKKFKTTETAFKDKYGIAVELPRKKLKGARRKIDPAYEEQLGRISRDLGLLYRAINIKQVARAGGLVFEIDKKYTTQMQTSHGEYNMSIGGHYRPPRGVTTESGVKMFSGPPVVMVSDTRLEALTHEIGHFLDDYAERLSRDEDLAAKMRGFKMLLAQTAANHGGVRGTVAAWARDMRAGKKQGLIIGYGLDLPRHIAPLAEYFHKPYVEYLERPGEIFARFIEQYVVEKLFALPETRELAYNLSACWGSSAEYGNRGLRVKTGNWYFPTAEFTQLANVFEKTFKGKKLFKALIGAGTFWQRQ